ncbi:hypothetical protein UY3_04249 [Chelonia mydas]|uniref:Uncharacterized protein n=1 Tax=Chelonia mydas TaxID=8469 RepID=M7C2A0_CHEMY|nr:hypothetical protein UY3_04249 [Chelonia mydas]
MHFQEACLSTSAAPLTGSRPSPFHSVEPSPDGGFGGSWQLEGPLVLLMEANAARQQ